MAAVIIAAFLVGVFLGATFGMLMLAFSISAKSNASHIPEEPIVSKPRRPSLVGRGLG